MNESGKLVIVIVCGYGCEVTNEYLNYIEDAADLAINKDARYIIVCGGFTQLKSHPDSSEAQVMKTVIETYYNQYMERLAENGKEIPKYPQMTKEECSLTTEKNLRNAAEYIGQRNITSGECSIIICCKVEKGILVRILADEIFGNYDVKIHAFDNTQVGDAEREFYHLILNFLAIKFAFFRKLSHWYKVRKVRRS